MKQYVVCREYFSEMQREMNNVEDTYDSIAPGTQSVEHQDQVEGSTDLYPDFNENYNMQDDIGIPSIDANMEPLVLNELQDYEYQCMVQIFNKGRKDFSFHVLHLIKTSDKLLNCFLSGVVGVGKSHLTKGLFQVA